MKLKWIASCTLALAAVSMSLGAAEFHPIASVTSTTAATDLWPVSNLIQGPGVGFANEEPHEQLGSGGTHRWVTAAPGGFPSDYIEESGTPQLVFDLGEDRALSEVSVWGYSTTNANGVSRFALRFATHADGPAGFSSSVAYEPAFDVVIDDRSRQSLLFEEVVVARYVEMTCLDNFYANGGFGPPGGGDRVGLGEVAFEDRVPNPNPVLEVASTLDFGNAASGLGPRTLSLTLANLGGQDALTVHSVEVRSGGPGVAAFSVAGASLEIPAGESAALPVTFDPGAAEGCFEAQLVFLTNDPARPEVGVLLVGGVNCVPPAPKKPDFSVEGGVFEESFLLSLSSETPGARIVFTTDGSLPGANNGQLYEGPILVANTTQVRAATISGDHEPAVATESYVRLARDLARYQSRLPIVIIENFGGGTIPNKGWSTSTQTGAGLVQPERQPAYLGIMEPDAASGVATLTGPPTLDSRIGIRVRGAFSSTWNPKPYSLETWKQSSDEDREVEPLGMPGESDWILYYPHPSYDRTMLFNTFTWELSGATGRYGTRFRFVDVFVNEDGGDLRLADRRGVYALAEKVTRDKSRIDFEALSEDGNTGGWLLGINRMDPEPASGFPTENGATSPQYFHTPGPNRVLETPPNSPGRGDDIPRQYNAFINFEDPNGYRITSIQRAAIEAWFRRFELVLYNDARWRDPEVGYRRYLDTRDFIDYFHLLNLAKQGDGLLLSMFPWVSSGERKLHMGPMWDFNNGAYSNAPTSTLYFRADRLWYPRLFEDPDYQREHIDRWFELRRGPFSDESMLGILDRQAAQLPLELVAAQGISVSDWASRLNAMKSYLTTRAAWIDAQFFAPPTFSSGGGVVGAGFSLSMRMPGSVTGRIVYTTDGSDPRGQDGAIGGTALVYRGAFVLNESAQVRARILSDAGDWSALNEATFVVGTPGSADNLVVSEIMYHPADPHVEAEYLELLNIADEPVDLTGMSFTDGIVFSFPAGTVMAPGERLLVVANRIVFEAVHGEGLPVVGEFAEGTRLENRGERITLTGADASIVRDFEYNDRFPWPEAADGVGFSLVLVGPDANPVHSDPLNWRRSGAVGGAPGSSDASTFAGDPSLDLDGDGRPALLEYFHGTSDLDPRDHVHGLRVTVDETGQWSVSYPRDSGAEDVAAVLEVSDDLVAWREVTQPVESSVSAGPIPVETRVLGPASATPSRFLRLRVTRFGP